MLSHSTATPTPPEASPLPPKSLNDLLYHETAERALADDLAGGATQFSQTSLAHVFEVIPHHGGILTEQFDDDGIRDWLKCDRQPADGSSLRILFLDAVPEEPNALPVTESLLRDVLGAFDVNPRFTDYLSRQHAPGREVVRRRDGGGTGLRHEMWYSAVLRGKGSGFGCANPTLELARQFAYWQRFCVWSDYRLRKEDNLRTGTTTYMIWRCPLGIKHALLRTFKGEAGIRLLEHPLAVHAFIMERIVSQTFDFIAYFAAPLHRWETKVSELRTPDDHTARSRAFLSLARHIHQVGTDYEILRGSIHHLKTQTDWFGKTIFTKHHNDTNDDDDDPSAATQNAQSTMTDILETLTQECRLIETCTQQYLRRSKIGVNECFALINQRDSELNIQIAQASHQDNRSLRVIQILSIIFLPGSLVSSVFGMGFFSTSPSPDGGGDTVFYASGQWWLYFAVSVPLTVFMLGIMMYYRRRDAGLAQKQWSRRRSFADPEARGMGEKMN